MFSAVDSERGNLSILSLSRSRAGKWEQTFHPAAT